MFGSRFAHILRYGLSGSRENEGNRVGIVVLFIVVLFFHLYRGYFVTLFVLSSILGIE